MKKRYIVFVVVLLMIHFLAGLNTIENMSPTYDEPVQIACGYSYWKTGEYKFYNIYYHPPFANQFATLPLAFMNPNLFAHHPFFLNNQQHSYADLFLYNNRIGADKLLNSCRIMVLLLSCFLGFMVFCWSKELHGELVAIIVLLLYVFCSNIIAHSTVATTDLAVTCFFFIGMYCFWRWMRNQTAKNAVLCGFIISVAVCSKFSALIVLPIFLFISVIQLMTRKIPVRKFLWNGILFFATVVFVSAAIYKFSHFKLFFSISCQLLAQNFKEQVK